MFEKLRIKQHMEVADAGGNHVGTVDSVDGDSIKLTRSDSSDGQHHYLDFDQVDRIEDNRVYLKTGASPVVRAAEQHYAAGAQKPFNSGQTINPNEYSSQRPSGEGVSTDTPLFGTSGHGTGVGGSGVGH